MRDELRDKFSVEAELIESSGGVFEVVVNGDLIFSKKNSNRFPEQKEIFDLVERFGII